MCLFTAHSTNFMAECHLFLEAVEAEARCYLSVLSTFCGDETF